MTSTRAGALVSTVIFVCLFSGASSSEAGSRQSQTRSDYDVAYIGPPLDDPVIQHAKETYVTFGCAYCHGITLTPRGEAADLMHSALVGADIDGSTIVPLLKAGIPQTAKLSPMPQFSDLSDQQLHAIARYIHYARQEGRYRELVNSPSPPGDVLAGQSYFADRCSTCHASDLNGIGRKYDAATLRDHLLKPRNLFARESFEVAAMIDSKRTAAHRQHSSFLENATATQVANLLAYLGSK
jgi:mono/diheme cytochrome c family protein